MNHSTENKGYFLSSVILIIAVGLLFFLKSERLSYNHRTCYTVSTVDLKADSQATPAIAPAIPSYTKISIDVQHNNPVFKSSSEISLNYSITKSSDQSLSKYNNAKPLIDKPFRRQLLPRFPDTGYLSLS